MKIGDLVLFHNRIFIVMSIDRNGYAMIKNIATGNTSGFPSVWLTKIKTDNFCP